MCSSDLMMRTMSIPIGQRPLQVPHAVQHQTASLLSTSSWRPNCTMRMTGWGTGPSLAEQDTPRSTCRTGSSPRGSDRSVSPRSRESRTAGPSRLCPISFDGLLPDDLPPPLYLQPALPNLFLHAVQDGRDIGDVVCAVAAVPLHVGKVSPG